MLLNDRLSCANGGTLYKCLQTRCTAQVPTPSDDDGECVVVAEDGTQVCVTTYTARLRGPPCTSGILNMIQGQWVRQCWPILNDPDRVAIVFVFILIGLIVCCVLTIASTAIVLTHSIVQSLRLVLGLSFRVTATLARRTIRILTTINESSRGGLMLMLLILIVVLVKGDDQRVVAIGQKVTMPYGISVVPLSMTAFVKYDPEAISGYYVPSVHSGLQATSCVGPKSATGVCDCCVPSIGVGTCFGGRESGTNVECVSSELLRPMIVSKAARAWIEMSAEVCDKGVCSVQTLLGGSGSETGPIAAFDSLDGSLSSTYRWTLTQEAPFMIHNGDPDRQAECVDWYTQGFKSADPRCIPLKPEDWPVKSIETQQPPFAYFKTVGALCTDVTAGALQCEREATRATDVAFANYVIGVTIDPSTGSRVFQIPNPIVNSYIRGATCGESVNGATTTCARATDPWGLKRVELLQASITFRTLTAVQLESNGTRDVKRLWLPYGQQGTFVVEWDGETVDEGFIPVMCTMQSGATGLAGYLDTGTTATELRGGYRAPCFAVDTFSRSHEILVEEQIRVGFRPWQGQVSRDGDTLDMHCTDLVTADLINERCCTDEAFLACANGDGPFGTIKHAKIDLCQPESCGIEQQPNSEGPRTCGAGVAVAWILWTLPTAVYTIAPMIASMPVMDVAECLGVATSFLAPVFQMIEMGKGLQRVWVEPSLVDYLLFWRATGIFSKIWTTVVLIVGLLGIFAGTVATIPLVVGVVRFVAMGIVWAVNWVRSYKSKTRKAADLQREMPAPRRLKF